MKNNGLGSMRFLFGGMISISAAVTLASGQPASVLSYIGYALCGSLVVWVLFAVGASLASISDKIQNKYTRFAAWFAQIIALLAVYYYIAVKVFHLYQA